MIHSVRRFALAIMLFVPAISLGAPQDASEIKGQLQNDDPKDPVRQQPSKIHEIKFSKGKTYQIDLTSKDFDSYLRLLDSAGKEVASDDDSGGELNSRIKYTPTQDDAFKIVVTTFAGGRGSYVLKIQGGAGVAAAKKDPGEEIALSVAGNLQATDLPDPVRNHPAKIHELKLKKGTSYQIDLMSKDFDSFLRIDDGAGRELAKDDDGGDGLNSRLQFIPEADATYKIYVTTFSGGQGNYNLVVKAGKAGAGGAAALPAPVAGKPAVHQGQIQANDPADPVRRKPAKIHTVELKGGKTYVIDLVSQFDNYLRLENAAGQQLAMDDDGGGNLNARIVFACPADGQYRVIATSFAGGQGPFNLQIAEQ